MDEQRRKIVEEFIKAYNAFDIPSMSADLHRDVVFENITTAHVDFSTEGIEEFRKQAEIGKTYFTQREQKVTSWNFSNDTVTIDIEYQAVLAKDFPNGMKAGDALKLKGQSVFEFKDGKIYKIQ